MFTWRLEVLVNFHPLDISAIMPKVFLWSWHCPRFLVDIISQESFEGRFPDGRREFDLFFLGLFQPHLVVHSLCKYVTTCYNYNPNYRWNLILLSPRFSGFQPASLLVLATAGTFWMDWEDWQFIMGQKLGASQVLVLMNHGSELVRKFTDMKQTCTTMHIYIHTYNIGKLYIYT